MKGYDGYSEAKKYYRDVRSNYKLRLAEDEKNIPVYNILQDLYITLLEDLDDRRPYKEQVEEFRSRYKEEDYPWMMSELFPGKRVGSGKAYNRYIMETVWKLPIK